ncbi:hypothetical protein NWE61_06115 [Mycoplasmopsis felis]|nr:hypothetical protein [Mycoplasmopsis felis]MCU9934637.1 hypothetical protein [Mycoplasmopsis felis]
MLEFISLISLFSIKILPSLYFILLTNKLAIVDLPEPVYPIIPNVWPAGILKLISFLIHNLQMCQNI